MDQSTDFIHLFIQEHLGDLLISMMYQPTNNRVVVVVMKAMKLKKMDIIGSCGEKSSVHFMLAVCNLSYLKLINNITTRK